MAEQQKSIPLPKAERGVAAYFASLKREMKKISWPTVPETNRLFGVVLAVCVLLMIVMGIVGTLADFIINRLVSGGGKG